MLRVLVSCKLEESDVATEIGEGVVGLGIPETKLEIWDAREAPSRAIFCRKLGRDKELEKFRLALKFVTVFVVIDEREARDIHPPAIVVLTNALRKKDPGLGNLGSLARGLELGLLLVPQTTSLERVRSRYT